MYFRPFQPVIRDDLIDREFDFKMAKLLAQARKAEQFLAAKDAAKVRKAQQLLERKGAKRPKKSRKAPSAPREPEGQGTFRALPICLGMASVNS